MKKYKIRRGITFIRYKIDLDYTFKRHYFKTDEYGMCDICKLSYPESCKRKDFNICQKANFNSLLYDCNFRYAYVIEKI